MAALQTGKSICTDKQGNKFNLRFIFLSLPVNRTDRATKW